jgi:hypothetical protein
MCKTTDSVPTRLADDRSRAAPVHASTGQQAKRSSSAADSSRTTASAPPATCGRCPRSPDPRAPVHYQRRRAAGDWHAAAQRNLFNRFLGQLHHCLTTRTQLDEATAFTPPAANLAALLPKHEMSASLIMRRLHVPDPSGGQGFRRTQLRKLRQRARDNGGRGATPTYSPDFPTSRPTFWPAASRSGRR